MSDSTNADGHPASRRCSRSSSVLVQIAGVAQDPRASGVAFDLAPLVVAAAGFLTGALPGALFGFGVGLFLDLAFAQTLGVFALVFTLVGYGAGRVRELRAPEAPFTPLALGARPPPPWRVVQATPCSR